MHVKNSVITNCYLIKLIVELLSVLENSSSSSSSSSSSLIWSSITCSWMFCIHVHVHVACELH